MSAVDISKWADCLFEAERRCKTVQPITEAEPALSTDDAYAIQKELIQRRVSAGERIVGVKVGLTSKAKQQDIGIDEPIYGWLTDGMALGVESPLSLGTVIHPRVEPEIVFILRDSLAGPGVGLHDVLAATSAVCCGLEVIDSRFMDFRFALPDVVADNASASKFVLGPTEVSPFGLDLSLLGCVLEENGSIVATAAGAAILGHPANAVAQVANFLGSRGSRLEPGWIVLSGGLTAARPLLAEDHVTGTFAHLGRVGLRAEA